MKYKYQEVDKNGYIIQGDGHTMFPEDVIKEINVLTADRDRLQAEVERLQKERDVLEISRNFYYSQWKENETITPWFEKDFQLPEAGRLLIVRVLGDDFPEMAYVEKSISEDCFVSCLTGERLKVTHWMYIPEFKDIDLIKAGELEQICNEWLTLKKEAGE